MMTTTGMMDGFWMWSMDGRSVGRTLVFVEVFFRLLVGRSVGLS
jgi:hypothetical protein